MAFLIRSRLLGLLLLASLPLDCTAALATAAAQQSGGRPGDGPASAPHRGVEERMRRIALAVREQNDEEDLAAQPDGSQPEGDDAAQPPQLDGSPLALTFINAPAVGWGNGGFRNGGFYNGGFRNGGFRNGSFRNGGFRNGGFRNGGGWRNASFRNGGGGFRNGGFRNGGRRR